LTTHDRRRDFHWPYLGANVHHTTAGLIVLFSASLIAFASCDRDARRSNAPTALAPAPAAPSDQAHPPAPAAQAPTGSAPSIQGSSTPTAKHAFREACPAIGCFTGLLINVSPQAGWPSGKYRFVIKHDGKTTICKGRIPRPPPWPSVYFDCNRGGVVWEDGGFEVHSYPRVVDIAVARDGIRLTHVHYDVKYKESWCGRPGCGKHRSAGVDLRLPAMP